MKREIKFRAFIKSLKWMVPVEMIDFSSRTVEVDLSDGNGDASEYEFDEIELMQFTGLRDKNGKEIYEGDIVEFVDLPHGDECLCVGKVIFEEFEWHFTNSITESSLSCYDSDVLNVIGNIHENQELLVQ